jgi:hypothetical protein
MEQVCALEGCGEVFFSKVHNQRFHSKECCRVYTNKRILEQYHQRRNKTLKNRICESKDCGTVLSVYNPNSLCGMHERQSQVSKLESWGWQVVEY